VLRDLRTGLLIAAIGMLVTTGLIAATGVVEVVETGLDLRVLALGTLVFAVSGLAEELVFRVLVLGGLRRLLRSAGVALVLSSLAFAALEMVTTAGTTAMSLASTVLGGIMYGVAYLRSGRIWLPVGLHFGWNWVQGTILGFPVSGTTDYSGTFATLRTTGADWLGGGGYGPEGSVFSLVGRLVIIALVLVATRQPSTGSGGGSSPRTRYFRTL
jgi:membrane protease YdiL (CAAX protease family)